MKLQSSFDQIKKIVNGIIKKAAELLLELELDKLVRYVKEDLDHNWSHLDPKEVVKSHEGNPYSKSDYIIENNNWLNK